MADQVTITNMPDSGSVARVAYDLMSATRHILPGTEDATARLQQVFDLYEQCYDLASGRPGHAEKVIT